MYSMLTSLLNDHSLKTVELESALILQGPFSFRSPIMELLLGPPFIQMLSGALLGSFRDSKNQKKVLGE